MDSRLVRLVVPAVLAALLPAGCSKSPAEPTDAPTFSSATSSSSSPRDKAAEDAERLLRSYYATLDRVRSDNSVSLSVLDSVASSTELNAYQRLVKAERKDGLRQTGSTRIARLEIQAVDLDNSDPSAGKVPTVQIDVCYDVSGVDVVADDGKSHVAPDRANVGWVRHTVANYRWNEDPDDGWRVATSKDIEREPCAG